MNGEVALWRLFSSLCLSPTLCLSKVKRGNNCSLGANKRSQNGKKKKGTLYITPSQNKPRAGKRLTVTMQGPVLETSYPLHVCGGKQYHVCMSQMRPPELREGQTVGEQSSSAFPGCPNLLRIPRGSAPPSRGVSRGPESNCLAPSHRVDAQLSPSPHAVQRVQSSSYSALLQGSYYL